MLHLHLMSPPRTPESALMRGPRDCGRGPETAGRCQWNLVWQAGGDQGVTPCCWCSAMCVLAESCLLRLEGMQTAEN